MKATARKLRPVPSPEPPPRDQVAATWGSAKGPTSDPKVAAYLRELGLDPVALEQRDCIRLLPRQGRPDFLSHAGGHRVALQLFDADMQPRSLLCAAHHGRANIPQLNAKGFTAAGLVGANAQARKLAPEGRPDVVVVVDTVVSFLAASQRWPEVAVLAVPTAAAWTEEHAARLPDDTTIVVATEHTHDGERIAARVGTVCGETCVVLRDSNHRSLGLALREGKLPEDPRDGTRAYELELAGVPIPDDVDPFTDVANVERLIYGHGADILHVEGPGWFVFDGSRFEMDGGGALVTTRAIETTRTMHREATAIAARAQDELAAKRAEMALGWAQSSQSARRIEAMVKLTRSHPTVRAKVEDLDANPMLLTVANGTLNLRTGALGPHRREDRITHASPVAWDPDAECPVFNKMLSRIFAEDEELIAYIWRAIGYSLTGLTSEQVFFICYGSGANGKSTLLEVLRFILGDAAMNVGADVLMKKRERGPDNDVARLRGARLVTSSEGGEQRQLDEERIKRLTGGDTVTARFLHREHFEFKPAFKLWLATNHRPQIQGTDHGIWRRVQLIPFGVTIPEEEQDGELDAKLRLEAPGILRRAVAACLEWQSGGLLPPERVLAATSEYRDEEDSVARFLGSECTIVAAASVTKGQLYESYAAWCEEVGEDPVSKRKFGSQVKALPGVDGSDAARSGSARMWRGIGLLYPGDDS